MVEIICYNYSTIQLFKINSKKIYRIEGNNNIFSKKTKHIQRNRDSFEPRPRPHLYLRCPLARRQWMCTGGDPASAHCATSKWFGRPRINTKSWDVRKGAKGLKKKTNGTTGYHRWIPEKSNTSLTSTPGILCKGCTSSSMIIAVPLQSGLMSER